MNICIIYQVVQSVPIKTYMQQPITNNYKAQKLRTLFHQGLAMRLCKTGKFGQATLMWMKQTSFVADDDSERTYNITYCVYTTFVCDMFLLSSSIYYFMLLGIIHIDIHYT